MSGSPFKENQQPDMRQLKITKTITNRDTQSLERYLQEIGKVELLTAEDEVVLAQRIRQGDQMALERLVKANLRFVVSVAKQYQNQSLSLNDLINEGNLGLLKAAQRFDESRGFKFISYAVWWIRQSIIQALAEHSRVVRLPLNKIGSLTKIKRAFAELEQRFEREPTADELAEVLDMGDNEVRATMHVGNRHVSMDAPFVDGESSSLLDVMEDSDAVQADEYLEFADSLKIETRRSLATLTERERDIVSLFFGIGVEHAVSLSGISDTFGLTRERVRQIKDKALMKLRVAQRSNRLMEFLGQE
jgi:RNA polymerase primary sigma factor